MIRKLLLSLLNSSVALATLAVAFLAAPAVAADVEPMPEALDWTAFHVGVGGGGNFGFAHEDSRAYVETDQHFVDTEGAIGRNVKGDANNSSELGKAGGFATVEAGFDYQMGSSVVAGLLANYDFGKTSLDNNADVPMHMQWGACPNQGECLSGSELWPADYRTKWKIGDSWAVGGRLGFLAMDNALIYALGGYSQAKVQSELSFLYEDYGVEMSNNDWQDGWFIGGGLETLLTQNISLKAEYRYNDYGKVSNGHSFEVIQEDGHEYDNYYEDASQKADITVHSVRAVLSYRFGL